VGIFKLEAFDEYNLLIANTSIYPDNGADLNEFLARAISQKKKHLIIDLSKVEIIYSTGITELVKANMTGKSQGVGLILVGVSKSVAKVFKLCGFERLFKIFPTLKDALEGIS
jgi:anti-sigma B factor antagonist